MERPPLRLLYPGMSMTRARAAAMAQILAPDGGDGSLGVDFDGDRDGDYQSNAGPQSGGVLYNTGTSPGGSLGVDGNSSGTVRSASAASSRRSPSGASSGSTRRSYNRKGLKAVIPVDSPAADKKRPHGKVQRGMLHLYLRRSCEGCRGAKCKCLLSDGPKMPCERCKERKTECVFAFPRKYGRPAVRAETVRNLKERERELHRELFDEDLSETDEPALRSPQASPAARERSLSPTALRERAEEENSEADGVGSPVSDMPLELDSDPVPFVNRGNWPHPGPRPPPPPPSLERDVGRRDSTSVSPSVLLSPPSTRHPATPAGSPSPSMTNKELYPSLGKHDVSSWSPETSFAESIDGSSQPDVHHRIMVLSSSAPTSGDSGLPWPFPPKGSTPTLTVTELSSMRPHYSALNSNGSIPTFPPTSISPMEPSLNHGLHPLQLYHSPSPSSIPFLHNQHVLHANQHGTAHGPGQPRQRPQEPFHQQHDEHYHHESTSPILHPAPIIPSQPAHHHHQNQRVPTHMLQHPRLALSAITLSPLDGADRRSSSSNYNGYSFLGPTRSRSQNFAGFPF